MRARGLRAGEGAGPAAPLRMGTREPPLSADGFLFGTGTEAWHLVTAESLSVVTTQTGY